MNRILIMRNQGLKFDTISDVQLLARMFTNIKPVGPPGSALLERPQLRPPETPQNYPLPISHSMHVNRLVQIETNRAVKKNAKQ